MKSVHILAITLPAVFFLSSCHPQPTQKVPLEFEEGQKLFHKVCASCHGADALGKETKAPALIDEDYISSNFSDADVRQQVVNGSDKMPSQRARVSDGEIEEIIKYLRYSQKSANLVADMEEPENFTNPSDEEDTSEQEKDS
ncbi:MAG: cytochrome C-552 [Nitrospinae bacterium CG11_big_fil_rev_8_21_14_0_20_56_8]|nr:MAG: cytochrome C-552 [Nitrospinae bacterium CG11_big_fil_rev_8_21_14_0_20_56_8]